MTKQWKKCWHWNLIGTNTPYWKTRHNKCWKQTEQTYICKSCHVQLQPKCTCVCCNTDVQKDISKMYNKLDYDFTGFVVSQCLGHVPNSGNVNQYNENYEIIL